MVSYHPLECLLLTFLLSTHFSTNYAQAQDTTQPEVSITQGTLLGTTITTRNGRDISGFLGIPFGEPPVGNLRFANPVAAGNWSGILNATVDPNFCAQIPFGSVVGDEDCLYLNVYTPQLPQSTNSPLLPVMVYVHGGAFQYGGLASTRFKPHYLLDEDVVFVVANYRVAALGFLSTGDEVASGNWGSKDQVLALEWVHNNIHHFGGDPDQVTVFGQSAGAGSVHLLTLSNSTIGLFHRYITQSGSALSTWAQRPRAAYARLAFELGGYVGCNNNTSAALISCLRTVDISDIVNSQSQFQIWEFLPDMMWGPTDEPDIEGAFLTDTPSNLFAAGKVRDLPWICGVVKDEGLVLTSRLYSDAAKLSYFVENIDYLLPIMLFYTYQTDSGAAWINAIKSYYLDANTTANTSLLLANLTMLAGDSHFYYPTRRALQQQYAVARNPQYFYTFNFLPYTVLTSYGVAHGSDIVYLFPSESLLTNPNATMSDADYEMVDTMVQLWTSFAINGTPTASALNGAAWQPFSTEDNYLRIGNESDTALEVQYKFFEERMAFWASLFDSLETEEEEEGEEGEEGEEQDPGSTDSGTVTLSSNLFYLLLVVCSKFVLSAATAGRLG